MTEIQQSRKAFKDFTFDDVTLNKNLVLNSSCIFTNNALSNIFNSQIKILATTNQIVLGTTNTTTINASAPSASRTYTIPDTGANSSFVMTDSNQTVNGVKTMAALVRTVKSVTANTTLDNTYSGCVITLTTQSSGSYTITLPAAASSAGLYYTFSVIARTNANNIIIQTTAAETTINGPYLQNAGVVGGNTSKHQVTLTQANLTIGDYLDFRSDGVSWIVFGASAFSNAFVFI